MAFYYEEEVLDLPIDIDVAQGAMIEVGEIKGNSVPGTQSDLEIVLTNSSDETADDLQIRAQARPRLQSLKALQSDFILCHSRRLLRS